MKKKNLLIFMTDGHRADCLGCGGNAILETPNVDRMAQEGVLCSRSFSAHTVCMPARASVFTGRYPHVHGVWANGIPLSRDEVTLAEVLATVGYRTCAAGKVHFEPQQVPDFPPALKPGESYYGFHEVYFNENRQGAGYLRFVADHFPDLLEAAQRRRLLPEAAHELTWVTDRAIEFVEREAGQDAPFFAFCSFHELSPPCHPPEGFDNLYAPEDMLSPKVREGELDNKPPYHRACYEAYRAKGRHPDAATLRRHLASYYNQTTFLDKQFGRLLDTLRRLSVLDETVVLFTSDHGLVMGDHWLWRHGPFMYDQVIRVPMVWRVPGALGAGRTVDDLVESVDVMPTALDLLGIDPPAGVQGRSMAPLLRGEAGATGRNSVLVQERESPELLAREIDPAGFQIKTLRTAAWKLIHYPERPYGELYDLANDPDEFDNLWADAGYQEKRREMEGLLLDRLCRAEDPLPEREYHW